MLDAAKLPVDGPDLLNALPGSYLILLPDAPDFTVAGASDDYLSGIFLQRGDAIGRPLFDVLPDDRNNPTATGVKNLTDSLMHVLEHKKPHRMADQRYDVFDPSTGRWEHRVWRRPLNKPVLDADGHIQYIIHWVEDTTERAMSEPQAKQANEDGDNQRKLLQHLFMQAPVAIAIFSGPQHIITLVNKAHLQLWARAEEEVLGKPLFEALPEARGQGYEELLNGVLTTGKPFYAKELHADLQRHGRLERVYFNFVYEPMRDIRGNITGVIAVANEITEEVTARRKVEAVQEATEKQKRLYEAITNNTPDLQYIFSLDYRFLYANSALLQMWGRSKEYAFGRGLRELGYEEWHAAMHEREIDEIVATRKPVRGVVSFPHAELGKRIYDYLLVPVFDEKGEVEAVAGTTRDITDIKQAETILEEKVKARTQDLENLNRELKRSNSNLEEFAHAASHDLKEPIRKIHFFTHQLKDQLATRLSESELRSFSRIESSTQRMGLLIDDLLLYSHVSQRPHEMEPINLNKKIQNVLEDLELDIQEKGAAITVDPLPMVKGYRRQLQQLFQNLISNALKYSKAGEPPRIRIRAEQKTEGTTAYHVISVSDNGIGFEAEHTEKIFQMFTRLHSKHEYGGTGVGLSIAKKVAENHGGFIRAESVPGEGTTFRVYLPIHE